MSLSDHSQERSCTANSPDSHCPAPDYRCPDSHSPDSCRSYDEPYQDWNHLRKILQVHYWKLKYEERSCTAHSPDSHCPAPDSHCPAPDSHCPAPDYHCPDSHSPDSCRSYDEPYQDWIHLQVHHWKLKYIFF